MKIIRPKDISKKVGFSTATAYRREREGTFPRRVKIGPGCSGWLEHELDEFLAALPRAERPRPLDPKVA